MNDRDDIQLNRYDKDAIFDNERNLKYKICPECKIPHGLSNIYCRICNAALDIFILEEEEILF